MEGACERFDFTDGSIKVPHIGWNEVEMVQSHPLLKDVRSGDEFYFVHSYFANLKESSSIYGVTEYGEKQFASIIASDNLFATQFHLEKSGELGLRLLAEFADWQGGSC